MGKKLSVIILVLIIAGLGFAQNGITVPNYYTQSDYLATTPGVSWDAAGASFNPAVWGMMEWGEFGFYWNDMDRQPGGLRNWAFQAGGDGIGFSMQNWEADLYIPTGLASGYYDDMKFTDYNIGLGFGDKEFAGGIGYSWSRGDIPINYERDNLFSFGVLWRPCRYTSLGYSEHIALSNSDKNIRSIFDMGIRPLGNQFLTLFGDAALTGKQSFKQLEWSAGLTAQAVPGIDVFGKYFKGGYQDNSFLIGISISAAGVKAMYMPHYDKDSKQVYNTYGVRLRDRMSKDILTDKVVKDKFDLNLKFDNQIKYRKFQWFDTRGMTLVEILSILEQAKNNPAISGITMTITEEMTGSWELIWEVREKMKEFKASGKKIYAFLERGGMRQYYLASVADKIMVDPENITTMMGFTMGRTYYKNLFNKLGIGFDEWRFFKYKSASEGFSRTSMSEADREQRQALVDGFYEIFRKDICESRGLTEAEFDNIIDEVGVLVADSMLTYKLADTTGREADFEEWMKKLNNDKKKESLNTKKLAMMKPLDEEWGIPPQIAIIYALGECSMNSGITANKLKNDIKNARENKHVKAVVFRADSPGGDILPSDIVTLELKKTAEKKPVIVSQGQVAASGGYWISVYGQKIVASPWTITGSIGVIGGFAYNNGFGDKIGMTFDKVQRGKHADFGYGINIPLLGTMPERNLTTEERARMEALIKLMYKNFVQKVADARKMEFDTVEKVAQGRVWTGTTGKEIGLVDEMGGLVKSVELARDAAKIGKDDRYEIIQLPKMDLFDPSMFMPKLIGMKAPLLQLFDDTDPELNYYRTLAKSQGQPFVMLSPEYITE